MSNGITLRIVVGERWTPPDRSCPRCGGTTWNRLVDWRKPVGFSHAHVGCAECGLTAVEVGIAGVIVADSIQDRDAHMMIPLADLEFEWIEPRDDEHDVLIGARLRHLPTGVTVEATSYTADRNHHTALQALALRLAERVAVE